MNQLPPSQLTAKLCSRNVKYTGSEGTVQFLGKPHIWLHFWWRLYLFLSKNTLCKTHTLQSIPQLIIQIYILVAMCNTTHYLLVMYLLLTVYLPVKDWVVLWSDMLSCAYRPVGSQSTSWSMTALIIHHKYLICSLNYQVHTWYVAGRVAVWG